MDRICQAIMLIQYIRPRAVIVALLFAFVPYVFTRGPPARIARRKLAAIPPRIS
jgi:hypothetical protein